MKTTYNKFLNENISYTIKAKNSLYKSTYNGYAFNRNKEYIIDHEDEKRIFIIDNEGKPFSFSKLNNNAGYYYIEDYFDIKEVELKLSTIKYNI